MGYKRRNFSSPPGDKVNGEGYSLSRVYLRLDATVRWDWQSGSNSVAENGSGWKTRGQLAQRHPCGASSRILRLRSKDARRQRFSTRFARVKKTISNYKKMLYLEIRKLVWIGFLRFFFSFRFIHFAFDSCLILDKNVFRFSNRLSKLLFQFFFSFLFFYIYVYLDIRRSYFYHKVPPFLLCSKFSPSKDTVSPENDYHLSVENYNVEVS